MSLEELVSSVMETSSGNKARFSALLKRMTPGESRALIAVAFEFPPTASDVSEVGAYGRMVQVAG